MYRVKNISYNNTYKVIGKHPDGRIFATRHGNTNGLYVVDRDLNLLETLSTTLLNRDENGLGNGIKECRILSTGTMLCWAIYRIGANQTVIWRSTDTTYSTFEPVFSLPNDISFIERSVDVSTLDDTIMCCEYTTNPQVGGIWSEPHELNVWRGTNDGRDWDIVHTRSRIEIEGDNFIRHFHAVQYDPYENLFWITTGDWAVENSISHIKPNGTNYTIVFEGAKGLPSQQFRTTSLMFTENYIWYGSDAYYQNDHYMARINRETRQLEILPYLPDDCIRLSKKISIKGKEVLIANKSYEMSPTNNGTTELLCCEDLYNGHWYKLYEWQVNSLEEVSLIYEIIDNSDGRMFVHIRKIKDDGHEPTLYTTAIVDLEKIKPKSYLMIKNGKDYAEIPMFDNLMLSDINPVNKPALRIKVDGKVKSVIGNNRQY
jgi:hypothetical protein